MSMVTDQEIAKGVQTLLRESVPNTLTSLNGVVQQLEAKLGLDLSNKLGFIRHQIDLVLRANPTAKPQPQQPADTAQELHQALQFIPRFSVHDHDLNFRQPPVQPLLVQNSVQPQQPSPHAVSRKQSPKESAPSGTKRRGGTGGLNKVCGVSPKLQAIVGEPALPRTEIVKQLWAYIRKNNLQDPSNKRKIICDDALRMVFETDCTDMFKMNKLLAKHILPLEQTKDSVQAKRAKVNVETTAETTSEPASTVSISESLAKFFGTGETEMVDAEVVKGVWEYIKLNRLENPVNPMAIQCDEKLRELLGCESISAVGIDEMLRRHLIKRS